MKKIALTAILVLSICVGIWYFSWTSSYGAANRPDVTRYQAASLLARALAQIDLIKISPQDYDMLKKLVIEFRGELESMGVDIARVLTAEDAGEAASTDAKPPRSTDLAPAWALDAMAQLAARGVISVPDGTYSGSIWKLGGVPDVAAAPMKAEPMPMMSLSPSSLGAGFSIRQRFSPEQETARYGSYSDNPVKQVATDPVTTFSLDVNTTSYANVRRFLNEGRMPPADAVRVEELINYFPPAQGDKKPVPLENSPFHIAYELAPCPWNEEKTILWMSVTARGMEYVEAPPANLVFLVDVSGSMNPPERLPLVKSALKMLVNKLRPSDNISLVTYAGYTTVALPATSGKEHDKIISAIDRLGAGGSTAGAAGLTLAYEQARKAFINGGVNRILLCTDGDFNVGVSSSQELENMVARERDSGITLSIFGFGTNNLNDEMMTRISSVGNGNYSYVDSMSEARKVLDEEMASTLVTVAKDVKAQIEFNPENVAEYRQIGYEKRQLENEDFSDDTVDAGDIGAGRSVTIMYELTPADGANVPESRYRSATPQGNKPGAVA
ncbi:MAG: VWA domain-containing protein [Synergistaceae bacterium]|jgi:Ca-activated chloride channel family protein|nr:VWA domain-containing protein [Synergistaceae bacterium]